MVEFFACLKLILLEIVELEGLDVVELLMTILILAQLFYFDLACLKSDEFLLDRIL